MEMEMVPLTFLLGLCGFFKGGDKGLVVVGCLVARLHCEWRGAGAERRVSEDRSVPEGADDRGVLCVSVKSK
jgi:hypothetical protein